MNQQVCRHDIELMNRRRPYVSSAAVTETNHAVSCEIVAEVALSESLDTSRQQQEQEQQQRQEEQQKLTVIRSIPSRWSFLIYSILFSANHSAGLACLALASTRFGSQTGAWQTSILYSTYTGSALLGLTVYVVQRYGPQRATAAGMALFSLYVWASCLGRGDSHAGGAEANRLSVRDSFLVYTGAALGGIGAGIAWTAQGVYLTRSAAAAAASTMAVASPTTSTTAPTAVAASAVLSTEMVPLPPRHKQRQYLRVQSDDEAVESTAVTRDNGRDLNARPSYSLDAQSSHTISSNTSRLASLFACAILVGETLFDCIATVLVRTLQVPWSVVFTLYFLIAVASTIGMYFVPECPSANNGCRTVYSTLTHLPAIDGTIADSPSHKTINVLSSPPRPDRWRQLTATLRLLVTDTKMKYMIGFTLAFGWSGAFLNAFVSGEVVPRALNDPNGSYVGALVALHGVVAALGSLVCGQVWWWPSSERSVVNIGRNEAILILGSISFGSVALPFLWRPNLDEWTWGLLVMVYTFQGLGRATFEGTLKVLFADYFPDHLEAAFSNIILHYGLSSATAYALSTRFHCTNEHNRFCVEYRDGSHHDIFRLAAVVVMASIMAVLGFLRTSRLASTCPVQQPVSR